VSENRPAPYTNGHTPAPPATSGAFFVDGAKDQGPAAGRAPALSAVLPARQPTVFPPEIANGGQDGLLYLLARAQITAFPAANWIVGAAMVALALLALQGGVWGWLGLALLAAALTLRVVVWRRTRRDWVHFEPLAEPARSQPPAAPAMAPLSPNQKLPVHVTGCLEVGNKVRRFALLPGFYRTFATREHALLCLCRGGRRLLLAGWPENEEGLWYAFAQPSALRRIDRGVVRYGAHRLPTLALEVDAIPTRGRPRRRAVERLLISAEEHLLDRIEADLRLDARVPSGANSNTAPAATASAAHTPTHSTPEARS
jgi:hypothetical protein